MKYIPLQGQTCKLYEIHTLHRDNPVRLHEIHTLTGTTLEFILNTYPYRHKPGNYMKYIPLQEETWKLHEIHTLTEPTLEIT